MTARTLFDSVDADELALVTASFGLAIAQAHGRAASSIVRDPRVSPDGLVAGLCKAHALGLASAITAAGRPLGLEGSDLVVLQEMLITASIEVVREMVTAARAEQRYGSVFL